MSTSPFCPELPPEEISALHTIARETATQAAHLILTRRKELVASAGFEGEIDYKSSAVDPVTEVDKMSERFIVDTLAKRRPRDGFLGEEGAQKESETGVTWVIDPIDGTVNFLYDLPQYAVSIAAVYDHEPVAGAVVNVATGEVYHACYGRGAWLSTEGGGQSRLRPRSPAQLGQSLVATGFGYDARQRAAQAVVLTHVLPAVRDIRRGGSAALDICAVAQGKVDAYFEHGIKAWDCAAGTVIAREAGVRVTHPGMAADGSELKLFLAAPPALWQKLLNLLDDVDAADVLPG